MKVVSLFSGCGGLDKGFEKAGFEIIWSNDFDKYAVQTYRANFSHPIIQESIENIDKTSIPDFDILIGGFPCQPFSMMGQENGFEDTRGTLFFRIAELVKYKIYIGRKPKVIVLENVRTLMTHNKKSTFKTILKVLEKDLNYKVFYKVLNSADYNVPQNRNRVFIVCFANYESKFEFPTKVKLEYKLQDLLESEVDEKYFLSTKILPTILSNGTGGYNAKSKIDLEIARPLCATMAKMHRASQDNYVTQNGKVRRLTPRECARLQGFEDSFVIPVSDSQAYKQLGNAVTVNVAYNVAKEIMLELNSLGEI